MFKLDTSLRSQIVSFAIVVKPTYSASDDEIATISCSLEHYDTTAPAITNPYPLVDFLVAASPA